MKMICFYGLEWEKEYLQKHIKNCSVEFLQGSAGDYSDLKRNDIDALCIFVDSKIDKKLIENFPNIKLIATRSTGYNHIDMEAVKDAAITVCTVPLYGKSTVAEYTFALMLMLARKMYEAYFRVRDGNFSRVDLCGFDLKDKTLGVIGTGEIGSYIVKLAHAFGMKVAAFDLHPQEELIKKYDCRYVNFKELLSLSDIVTLHVPYNKATHHLLNEDAVRMMKKGAYLVNTARGAIVDTNALVYGLKEKIIAGAGLDVLECEGDMVHESSLLLSHPQEKELKTLLANHYLIQHPHVIVTAHNAFNTYEARRRMLDCTVQNIEAFCAGNPVNVVCY